MAKAESDYTADNFLQWSLRSSWRPRQKYPNKLRLVEEFIIEIEGPVRNVT
jgi:hypothetical protein